MTTNGHLGCPSWCGCPDQAGLWHTLCEEGVKANTTSKQAGMPLAQPWLLVVAPCGWIYNRACGVQRTL